MSMIDSKDDREDCEKIRKSYENLGRICNGLAIRNQSENYTWDKGHRIFFDRLLKKEYEINGWEIFKGVGRFVDVANLLRDALASDNERIFSTLLLCRAVDLSLKDDRGRTIVSTIVEDKILRQRSNVEYAFRFVNEVFVAQMLFDDPSNPSDGNGMTHFHAACMTKQVQFVEFFLKNARVNVNDAMSVDSPYFAGFTPLHLAVEYLRPSNVEILLKHGADIHMKDAAGLSPLHAIVKRRLEAPNKAYHYEILKIFIDFMMNNNVEVVDVDACGFSLLHAVIVLQLQSLIENVLDKTDNVNRAVNWDSSVCPGYTPLHFAVFCSNFRIFELLLEKGADIRAKNARGVTAFDLMCLRNKHDLRQIHSVISTIAEWQSIVLSDDRTKLVDVVSAMESKDKFVDFLNNQQNLIDSSVFVPLNSTLWPGYTVLHITVMLARTVDDLLCHERWYNHHRDSMLIEECLERGADVTIKDVEGSTPIHLAFNARKYDIAAILLSRHYRRTDNPVDKNNLSHFHIACALGHRRMVQHFLSNGVDVNSPGSTTFSLVRNHYLNAANSTALHFSVAAGRNRGIVEKLLANGADVNAKDANGFTPVHRLISQKTVVNDGTHDVLLSNDRLEDSTTSYGNLTHLHVACYYKHLSSVEKLLKSGADANATVICNDRHQRRRLFHNDLPEYYYGFSAPREDNNLSLSLFLQNYSDGYLPLDFLLLHVYDRSNKQLVRIIFMMIEHYVDISARSRRGTSPLERLLFSFPDDLEDCYETFSENATVKARLEKELGITELHLACYLADCQKVEQLIGKGMNVNSRVNSDSPIWRGYTPLHCTVKRALEKFKEEKDLDCDFIDRLARIVRLLTKHGADLLLTDEEGDNNTPLHLIGLDLKADKLRKVSLFVSSAFENLKDFSVNPTNLQGISLFHLACVTQNQAAIEKFLKQGNIDVNQAIGFFLKICPGSTALHLLVKYHHSLNDDSSEDKTILRILDLLMDNRVNVNAQDGFGNTPLFEVIGVRGSIRRDLIEKFISIGADVHAENVKAVTAFELLLTASDEATWEEIQLFLNAGYHFNMYNSIREGYLAKAFRFYVQREVEILKNQNFMRIIDYLDTTGMIDADGRSALHNLVSIDFYCKIFGLYRSISTKQRTIIKAYTKLIQCLSMRGCDIDQQDNEGQTALHLAVRFDNLVAIEGLLNNGADVNVTDNSGKTIFAYFSCSKEAYWTESNSETTNLLARHVYKLKFCGQRVSEQQKSLKAEKFYLLMTDNHRDRRNTVIREIRCNTGDFHKEIEKSMKLKIGSTFVFSLYEFLMATDMDVIYKNMTMGERREVDQFIENIDKYQFCEIDCMIKLKYRQSIEGIKLLEPALASFNILIKWQLPDLCCRSIVAFLSNHDLKQLIASVS